MSQKREDVRPRFRARAICDAIAGALSGGVSRFAVGPLDVLKIRFQIQIEPISTQFATRRPKYTGILQAFQTIIREEGITVDPTHSNDRRIDLAPCMIGAVERHSARSAADHSVHSHSVRGLEQQSILSSEI